MQDKDGENVKIVKRFLMILLVLYALYVGISIIVIGAAQKPSASLGSEGAHRADKVALIESGSVGAKVRLGLIDQAKESIDIAYYTLTDGSYTREFLSYLLHAADRGVRVRILLDGATQIAYIRGELKQILQAMHAHPCIDVKYFEPLRILHPYRWNYRLHEKLMVFDNNYALIGGRNIGDKYYLEDEVKERFVKDRDVLFYNESMMSIVQDILHYYDELWTYNYTKEMKHTISSKNMKEIEKIFKEMEEEHTHSIELISIPLNWHEVELSTFIHNNVGNGNKDPLCLKALLELASDAKVSMLLQSPYLIPSKQMVSYYNQYEIDLSKATILTNSLYSSPNPIAVSAYYAHRNTIIENVNAVYEFQGSGSIHAKTYLFDDDIAVLGTYNIDSRSSFINTESIVIIKSKSFSDELRENMQVDFDKSLLVKKDYSYEKSESISEGEVSSCKRRGNLFLSKITRLFEHLL